MTINKIKLFVIALFTLPMLATAIFQNTNQVSAVKSTNEDAAATYKAKCAACHGPAAAKFFDPAKPLEEHVEIILKGKKGEKPPFMPGYESKGMTADEAKALAEYMISLRKPSS